MDTVEAAKCGQNRCATQHVVCSKRGRKPTISRDNACSTTMHYIWGSWLLPSHEISLLSDKPDDATCVDLPVFDVIHGNGPSMHIS